MVVGRSTAQAEAAADAAAAAASAAGRNSPIPGDASDDEGDGRDRWSCEGVEVSDELRSPACQPHPAEVGLDKKGRPLFLHPPSD